MSFKQTNKTNTSSKDSMGNWNLKPQNVLLFLTVFFLATMKTWKLISYFVAIPGCLLCAYNAVLKEKEHHTHPRPEFVPYTHLRLRKKAFPWGDGNHSLFHNPHANALPEGYEDEDHDHWTQVSSICVQSFVHYCCFQGMLLIEKLFEDLSAYDNVIYGRHVGWNAKLVVNKMQELQ